MYQEWDSPQFTSSQLSEFCKEFFEARNFHTESSIQGDRKILVKTVISPINTVNTLTIESKGRKIRLTFPPPSHATDGLMRLGALLVTGRAFKAESEKAIFLDTLEQQFWEYLDSKLATIPAQDMARGASKMEP